MMSGAYGLLWTLYPFKSMIHDLVTVCVDAGKSKFKDF
jgi:hypothetical protein